MLSFNKGAFCLTGGGCRFPGDGQNERELDICLICGGTVRMANVRAATLSEISGNMFKSQRDAVARGKVMFMVTKFHCFCKTVL